MAAPVPGVGTAYVHIVAPYRSRARGTSTAAGSSWARIAGGCPGDLRREAPSVGANLCDVRDDGMIAGQGYENEASRGDGVFARSVRAIAAMLVATCLLAPGAGNGAAGAGRHRRTGVAVPVPAMSGGDAIAHAVWLFGRRVDCPTRAAARTGEPRGSAVVASLDGGRAWRTVWTTRRRTIQNVAFATPAQGFMSVVPDACGFGGAPPSACATAILSTVDAGRAWRRVFWAPRASVADLTMPTPGVGWAWAIPQSLACRRASARCPLELLRSAGADSPWRVVYRVDRGWLTGSAFAYLKVGSRQLGWTVAGGAVVLATRDGGRRWRSVGRLPLARNVVASVSSIDFVSARHGLLTLCDLASVGNGGCQNRLYETLDGGRTWSRAFALGCIDWMAVHMRNRVDGTVVTGGATTGSGWPSNALYGTTDGGARWKRLAVVPAILSSAVWSGPILWVTGVTCAYAAGGTVACRNFAARIRAGPRLVPEYPTRAPAVGGSAPRPWP